MNSKIIAIIAISVLLAGGGSFYGGMKYQEGKSPLANLQRNGANFRQFGQNNGAVGGRQAGGAANGEIVKKDDSSVTIKTNDGSTKIVYLAASTTVSKFSQGAGSDLTIGESVMVSGSLNSDGSVTAQFIQIRPSMEMPGQPQPSQSVQGR